VNVKFSGLNENALRPFMEPLLAGKSLRRFPSTAWFPGNTIRGPVPP